MTFDQIVTAKVQQQLGELVLTALTARAQVEQLTAQLEQAQARIEELEKPKDEAAPSYG